jgi:hypothetical protein
LKHYFGPVTQEPYSPRERPLFRRPLEFRDEKYLKAEKKSYEESYSYYTDQLAKYKEYVRQQKELRESIDVNDL